MGKTNYSTSTDIQDILLENRINKFSQKIDWFIKNRITLTQGQRSELVQDFKNIQEMLDTFGDSQNNHRKMHKSKPKRKKNSNANLLLGFILNYENMIESFNNIVSSKVESDFKAKQAKKAEAERTIKAIETCYGKPQRSWDYFQSV